MTERADKGRLYLVSTPIGNLGDLSLRAVEILKQVDVVACEDTRHSRKLLSHYDIKTALESYHDHSGSAKLDRLMVLLADGKQIAYVTDCGMPLVSDPGFPLVREALRQDIALEVIPGATASITALVGSGIPCEKFIFEGYLPVKSHGRRKSLEALKTETRTLIFYESPHRIHKTLNDMLEIIGPERPCCVARELTKKFEEYTRGTLKEVTALIAKKSKLGELVIILQGDRG